MSKYYLKISRLICVYQIFGTVISLAGSNHSDKSTLIYAVNNDSIYCNSIERNFYFVLISKNSTDTLLFEESLYSGFKQCVTVDFDNDKINETIISFGDEGFYDLLVYKISKVENRYVIKKVFAKTGIDNPQDPKVPYLTKNKLNTVYFYSINNNAKTVRYKLSYNVQLCKYQIQSIK